MEMEKINKCAEHEEGLKVIGAGLSHTGTLSLRDALNILGFPCYHYIDMLINKQQSLWMDVFSGKSEDWKSIFGGYTATVDFPSVKVYEKLMEAYPEAKIILTMRHSESWYQSLNDTVYRAYKEVVCKEKNFLRKKQCELFLWEGLFQGRFEEKEYAISVFEAHVEKVKKSVPANKLLVFNVEEGWSPLCKFLGVPLPSTDTPFPHSNDKKDFVEREIGNVDANASMHSTA